MLKFGLTMSLQYMTTYFLFNSKAKNAKKRKFLDLQSECEDTVKKLKKIQDTIETESVSTSSNIKQN